MASPDRSTGGGPRQRPKPRLQYRRAKGGGYEATFTFDGSVSTSTVSKTKLAELIATTKAFKGEVVEIVEPKRAGGCHGGRPMPWLDPTPPPEPPAKAPKREAAPTMAEALPELMRPLAPARTTVVVRREPPRLLGEGDVWGYELPPKRERRVVAKARAPREPNPVRWLDRAPWRRPWRIWDLLWFSVVVLLTFHTLWGPALVVLLVWWIKEWR